MVIGLGVVRLISLKRNEAVLVCGGCQRFAMFDDSGWVGHI
jgi:hypothetical protein